MTRAVAGPAARRRSTWLGRRTAGGLALGALLAVAGLVTLLVLWLGLLTASLRTGLSDAAAPDDPAGACVAAATDGAGDATLTSTLFPPRAACTWTVEGERSTTVLAERSATVATVAAVVAAAGVLVVAVAVAAAIRSRRTARDPASGSAAA